MMIIFNDKWYILYDNGNMINTYTYNIIINNNEKEITTKKMIFFCSL